MIAQSEIHGLMTNGIIYQHMFNYISIFWHQNVTFLIRNICTDKNVKKTLAKLKISANVRRRMPHLSKHVFLSYVLNVEIMFSTPNLINV